MLELQIVVTTHSPIILDELPNEARAQIIQTPNGRAIVYGITPELAMTKMDDVPQYECDLYEVISNSQKSSSALRPYSIWNMPCDLCSAMIQFTTMLYTSAPQ